MRMPATTQFAELLNPRYGSSPVARLALGVVRAGERWWLRLIPALITALDRGFLGLYNLDFTGAQKDFSAWETAAS